jgi:hypothetical protein
MHSLLPRFVMHFLKIVSNHQIALLVTSGLADVQLAFCETLSSGELSSLHYVVQTL